MTDNTYDIGSAGANRPRNIFPSSSVVNKTKAGTPTDADVANPADGMLIVDTSASKLWVRMGGVWAVSAPGAHHASHETGGADALAALSAAILTSGTLPDARLSGNVAMLASPAFTGVPTAPTAAPGTNTTQLATTAFVLANVSGGAPAAHHVSHETGGADALAALSAAILTTGTLLDARLSANVLKFTGGYPGGTTNYLRADGTFAAPTAVAAAHHATHEPGGSDALVGAAWLAQANVFTKTYAALSHALQLKSALPLMSWLEDAAPADSKLWRLYANSSRFLIQPTKDDDATATGTIIIDRACGLSGLNTLAIGATPATVGAIRLENASGNNRGVIYARNAANTADIPMMYLNATNQVVIGENQNTVASFALKTIDNNFVGQTLAASGPQLYLRDTSAAANLRMFQIYATGAILVHPARGGQPRDTGQRVGVGSIRQPHGRWPDPSGQHVGDVADLPRVAQYQRTMEAVTWAMRRTGRLLPPRTSPRLPRET